MRKRSTHSDSVALSGLKGREKRLQGFEFLVAHKQRPGALAHFFRVCKFHQKIKRNGGFDFSKLLRKSKNDKQQF